MSYRNIRRGAGFTLIEIMVVVVIIALLSAFIIPRVIDQVDRARVTKVRGDIQALETALTMFKLDTARYPSTETGLAALVKKPDDSYHNWKDGGYLSKVSKDPWGNEYRYVYPGVKGREFDLYSLGPDGKEGTDESDKDNIGNWNLEN